MNNLLSRPAALAKGLVQRVYRVHSSEQKFGLLKTQPVKIVIQDNAQPCAVHAERPSPSAGAVKEELAKMETKNIIEAVTEPTEWCTLMVPVPKKSGQARI